MFDVSGGDGTNSSWCKCTKCSTGMKPGILASSCADLKTNCKTDERRGVNVFRLPFCVGGAPRPCMKDEFLNTEFNVCERCPRNAINNGVSSTNCTRCKGDAIRSDAQRRRTMTVAATIVLLHVVSFLLTVLHRLLRRDIQGFPPPSCVVRIEV